MLKHQLENTAGVIVGQCKQEKSIGSWDTTCYGLDLLYESKCKQSWTRNTQRAKIHLTSVSQWSNCEVLWEPLRWETDYYMLQCCRAIQNLPLSEPCEPGEALDHVLLHKCRQCPLNPAAAEFGPVQWMCQSCQHQHWKRTEPEWFKRSIKAHTIFMWYFCEVLISRARILLFKWHLWDFKPFVVEFV